MSGRASGGAGEAGAAARAGRVTYRADIDGLRAVAVLAVLAFHAGAEWMPGGYAGVDVFFVVSGFLITSIIAAEIEAGSFTMLGFWERRARRILPALFVVLATSAAAAWAILLPKELMEFGFALRGASLMAANFALADLVDYFAGPAEMQPLLHIWSLGVEEQFYVVFPLLLAALTLRAPRLSGPVLAALLAVSLSLGEWGAREAPENAFFLPHMRVWELLFGALLALGAALPLPARWRGPAAGLGAMMLAFAFAVFDKEAGFPGWPALVPVIGTVLILHAGAGATLNPVSRALAWRPLVGVGLISYSLYLWHWPVLVFARQLSPEGLSAAATAALLALSFALAWGSWRWVERPFRGRGAMLARGQVFAVAGIGSALLFSVGLAAKLTDGAAWRFGPEMRAVLEVRSAYFNGPGRACSGRVRAIAAAPDAAAAAALACRFGEGEGPPEFVLWGDLLSMALHPGMDEAARMAGMRGVALARSACPPLPRFVRRGDAKSRVCREFNDRALEIATLPSVRAVILHAHLLPILRREDGAVFRARMLDFARELAQTGRSVILVASVPDAGFDVPTAVAGAIRFGRAAPQGPALEDHLADIAPYREMLEEAGNIPGVTVLYPWRAWCREGRCEVMRDGAALYADRLHPGPEGARLLAPMLAEALRAARAAGDGRG